ncbi:alpha-L-rhamnosidase [Mucilaginibacter aquatilis]|uniref:alpha-L-rhamnosidase n=1 Tax=Mucilaginibacter aquatilis TaxID=1517760 RepID=A0A6I4I959_9SPHI|nr:alpha-L-rhamnosidase [Mucilaginibacter aquatilis]MVN91795.1 Bacterial alpha-L-rhamnosidase [Mucilaginibacter aquatilis]
MKWISVIAVVVSFLGASNVGFAQCKPAHLQCESLTSPLGIDVQQPRLTWNLLGCTAGAQQVSYNIVVGTDSVAVSAGKGNVWQSGSINRDDMLAVVPSGLLQSFTRYYWQVTVKNNAGTSATSVVSNFETALMSSADWRGAWITDGINVNEKPAGYFRKAFKLTKPVKSARAYIVAAGLYELYLNGKKVGNHRLDPMFTRFDRRNLYITHDVTAMLNNGQNALGVLLGNGWYNHQSTAVWFFDKTPWRARPKFCMDVHITYADGTKEIISTDNTWKTSHGPLIFNSIYTAEHYDARLEQNGWNTASFIDTAWKNAIYTSAPSKNIVAQQLYPIRDVQALKPVGLKKLNTGSYVFDFGHNMAGVSQIKVKGSAGTTLRLIHGERLKPDGHVDQSNIDYHYRPTDDKDPFHQDILILSGKKEDTFRATFNYKGFQYVEVVSSEPVSLTKESMIAYFMHSDVPAVGKIQSSSTLLNKIWQATNNSYLSNFFGYPTDCPQREKNGWTGDAHIAVETGLYNFDGKTIYEKWLADHRDEQQPNGVLPAIIPTAMWGYDWANGPDWTSTIAIIPWNLYLFYGDKRPLEQNYEGLKRYVDHIESLSPAGLTDWGLGDWIPIKSQSNKELTSSIYYFIDAGILAKAAKVLGKQSDHEKYHALADKIKNSVNKKFYNQSTGSYCSGYQTELSAPLYWGLVPDGDKAKVAKNLALRVQADGGLDVGLLGSKTILNALSENGYTDLAYKLASNEKYPSWGWWIKNGATTLYENWKIEGSSDISLNHIMFGEISAWYYKALGGIFPDANAPGFKTVILKPNFVNGLTQFSATHTGPYGDIVSSWKKKGNKVSYDVTVPANSNAVLEVKATNIKSKSPASGVKINQSSAGLYSMQLQSGSYRFDIQL